MQQLVQSTFMGMRVASLLLGSYWCIIFAGTHYPKMRLPGFQWADKVYHLIAFAGLSFLLAWALPKHSLHPTRHVWIAAALAIVYGAFDELSQSLVRGRNTEFLDFLADSLGAIVGLACYFLIRKFVVQKNSLPADKRLLSATSR